MIECPVCSKEERFQDFCPCCKHEKRVSFNRLFQFRAGDLLLYQHSGREYEQMLLNFYREEIARMEIPSEDWVDFAPYEHRGDWENERGFNQNHDILFHYINQLKGEDCITRTI